MKPEHGSLTRLVAAAAVALAATTTMPLAQGTGSFGAREAARGVQRALERLPYYGVFDFLAFGVDRGTVTLMGHAYRPALRSEAEAAVRRVSGIDDVVNRIEVLPTSDDDDRIRYATFNIVYQDDFLSRYTPGGPVAARFELMSFARFPGMQPYGTYAVHIIVKHRRTTLVGVVGSETDRRLALVRARQIGGVFEVEDNILVR